MAMTIRDRKSLQAFAEGIRVIPPGDPVEMSPEYPLLERAFRAAQELTGESEYPNAPDSIRAAACIMCGQLIYEGVLGEGDALRESGAAGLLAQWKRRHGCAV